MMVAIGDIMRVTRSDIIDFPGDTIDLILQMQRDGWRGQRSNRNHVMLLAPDGVTRLSASRNKNSGTYLAEDLRRYNKAQGKEEAMLPSDVIETTTDTPTPSAVVKKRTQKFHCDRPGCPKAFGTEKQLKLHQDVDHDGMLKCPDCDQTFAKANALGAHRHRKHGYVSPKREQRKAQEANRAKADAEKVLRDSSKAAAESVKSAVRDIEAKTEADRHLDAKERAEDREAEKEQTTIIEIETFPVSEVTAVDIVEEVNRQLAEEEGVAIEPEVEHISFIDDRDSWTIDINEVNHKTVASIQRELSSYGLDVEIRVWRKK